MRKVWNDDERRGAFPRRMLLGMLMSSLALMAFPNAGGIVVGSGCGLSDVNAQYIEWACYSLTGKDTYFEFGADWKVPNALTVNNLASLWNGLTPGDGSIVLQPVLWWGCCAQGAPAGKGGGLFWSAAAVICCPGPGGTQVMGGTVLDHIPAGDTVHGEMFIDNSLGLCSTGVNTWVVKIWDATANPSGFPNSNKVLCDNTNYTIAWVTLEVPGFVSSPQAAMLPGTTTFTITRITKQGATPVTPAWSSGQNCQGGGLGVTINSATSITLATGNGPYDCGGIGSSGGGGGGGHPFFV